MCHCFLYAGITLLSCLQQAGRLVLNLWVFLIFQNLNQSVAHDWTSGLQKLILKKEDEIRAADRCRIQLQLPGKQDKSVEISRNLD